MKIYTRHLVSIFKLLFINIRKQFSVIGQLVATSCFKPLKRSRELVVTSALLLTLHFAYQSPLDTFTVVITFSPNHDKNI